MSGKLRVGIVGVGNCASSFIQGLTYYADASGNEPIAGLMNPVLGGYRIADIEISSAVPEKRRRPRNQLQQRRGDAFPPRRASE